MRAFICSRLPRLLATMGALNAIVVAIEARSLGIGHSPTWGPYRKALALIGVGTFILAQRALFASGARSVVARAGRSLRVRAIAAHIGAPFVEW
jgi:hypothetical protein